MNNSFSSKAKSEALTNFKFSKKDCCNVSFLYGYFWGEKDYAHRLNNEKEFKTIKKLLSRYSIYVMDNNDAIAYDNIVISNQHDFETLYKSINECNDCLRHFLTGAFVSRAVISDPSKDYSLKFTYEDNNYSELLYSKLLLTGLDFKISNNVIYTKNSEVIEDLLAFVGAQSACLELINDKVVKDVRNRTNRITNCDTANITKTVNSSVKYIQAIEKLKENKTYDYLSDDLKYIATLKLDNPELSLSELSNISDPYFTKSSINRRLNKLLDLANKKENYE